MRILITLILLSFCSVGSSQNPHPPAAYYELWDISNLDAIGGHPVTILGDPQVVSTEIGDAVRFDGHGDRLLVDFNPIMDAREFTVELVFKPDACYPKNTDPRFLHIQDPDDPDQKRVMIELRIDENNQCYMDGFMKTDAGSLPLLDETLVHPTEQWQHVAITYKDSTLTTFFNGVQELSGTVPYKQAIVNTIGKTSIGARMNEVKFYAGLIKTLKFTHACLDPKAFTFINDSTGTYVHGFSSPTGIEGVEVFPVPANESCQIKWSTEHIDSELHMSIHDTAGSLVHSQELGQGTLGSMTINTTQFLDGIYILGLHAGGHTAFKRMVVLH